MIRLRSQLLLSLQLHDTYYRVSWISYLSDRCHGIRRCCSFLAHRPHMAAILNLGGPRYTMPLASHQSSLLIVWCKIRYLGFPFPRSCALFSELFKMEVCVDSVQSALNAERGGEYLIFSVCPNCECRRTNESRKLHPSCFWKHF